MRTAMGSSRHKTPRRPRLSNLDIVPEIGIGMPIEVVLYSNELKQEAGHPDFRGDRPPQIT